MRKKKGRGRFIFFCLAPAVFLFAIFMIYPTIGVFRMSMYKWGGYTSEKTFVGLDNFKTLFQSDKFYQAFQNTVLLIIDLYVCIFADLRRNPDEREDQRTELFPDHFLYPEYFVRCSYQCDLFCNLRSESGAFEFLFESVPWSGRSRESDSLAGKSEDRYLQYCDRYDLAGNRLLYGNVYGKYGKCTGKSLRVCKSGGSRKDQTVFLDHTSADLDKYPDNTYIFHYQYH